MNRTVLEFRSPGARESDYGRAAWPLTTPALLSHRTPTLPGEEGDCFKLVFCVPPLSRRSGGRTGERGKGE